LTKHKNIINIRILILNIIVVYQGGKFMYAVVFSGGKQYKVQKDEILRVEKISGDIGAPVSFDKVLMFSDGENVNIGQPVLENVSVNGHIVEQDKAKKIIVFKYKRRKRYRRKQGHRQQYTAVKIDSILQSN
jgi:large subunit ribosomal protein L21